MNKNETKLLVENWRKYLDEDLHNSDQEILEEGLKDALGKLGLAVALTNAALPSVGAAINNPAQAASEIMDEVLGEKSIYALQAKPFVLNVYKDTPESLKPEVDKKLITPFLEEVEKSLSKKSEGGLSITLQEKQNLSKKLIELSKSFVKYLKSKKPKKASKETTVSRKYKTGLLNRLSPEQLKRYQDGDTKTKQKILDTLLSLK